MRVLHSVARAWHVDNATVYLQPELLAPPEQFEYHRALEFVAINPKHAGKKYRYRNRELGTVGKLFSIFQVCLWSWLSYRIPSWLYSEAGCGEEENNGQLGGPPVSRH